MSDEKVFCIPELRLYILSYMIEPDACLKCGVSDKSYYIYSHDYPKYCICVLQINKIGVKKY